MKATKKKEAIYQAEELVAMWHGGELHAVFPTALRSLCGVAREALVASRGSRKLPLPTCGTCRQVVSAWAERGLSGLPPAWMEL